MYVLKSIMKCLCIQYLNANIKLDFQTNPTREKFIRDIILCRIVIGTVCSQIMRQSINI